MTGDQGAWTSPPLDAGPRDAIRAALGVGPVAPVVEEVDVVWEPERWLAALDEGEVAGLLESSAGPDDVARWSIFGSAPRFVLTARRDGTAEVDGRATIDSHLLDVLDALRHPELDPAAVPFVGGLIGYLAYDAGRWFEVLPDTVDHDIGTPPAAFAYYDAALVHDGRDDRTYLVRTHPDVDAGPWLEDLTTRAPNDAATTVGREAVEWNLTRDEYIALVGRARDYVFAGDVFEVCLSRRFTVPLSGPPAPVYAALRHRSPSPFAAYCGFADHTVLSSSPERFLSYDGARLETRPIKGTSRRHDDPATNAEVVAEMRADRKQMAEHLMIVDLSRSDLGRVCVPGTVAVPHLARAETYSHVNHLVSVIEGRPPVAIGVRQLLSAAFPGGSITGAPKVRSMEVIDELEPVARGAYTGSVGYLSVDGRVDLNIAIRTLVAADGRLHGQVGGAVVADSDPAAEWQETEDKAQGMLAALAEVDPG
ncbi:MAG TPA: aminodeoxychorismate synthase component I [Iamia sp.]|nr:aminodeoxychorismate synthase component I [Iamia sp.]